MERVAILVARAAAGSRVKDLEVVRGNICCG